MSADQVGRPVPSVGDALPEVEVPITATLIAAGAFATRDYMVVHHDRDAARAAGTKDIFMNILTTNGLVGKYVADWAGPRTRLTRLDIRLGAPNHPGDTMSFSGEVTRVQDQGGAGSQVTVSILGANSLGQHVTGTADVHFLGGASA